MSSIEIGSSATRTLGLQDDRPGHHHSLLLSTRQVARVLGQEQLDRREAHPLERLHDPCAAFRRRPHAVHPERRRPRPPRRSSTGLSAAFGSWKTIWTSCRISRSWRRLRSARFCVREGGSSPRSRAPGRAARDPAWTCRCRSRRPAPRPRRGRSSRLTPSTALTVPVSRPNSLRQGPAPQLEVHREVAHLDQGGRARSGSSGFVGNGQLLLLERLRAARPGSGPPGRPASTRRGRRRDARCRSGSWSAQTFIASGQRGWNRHPSGGSTRSGGAPGMKLSPVVVKRDRRPQQLPRVGVLRVAEDLGRRGPARRSGRRTSPRPGRRPRRRCRRCG